MWKEEDNAGIQPSPTLAIYTEAVNKFTRSASAFMQYVHLLTEARQAYQEAMVVSTTLRRSLDVGDQRLRSLMNQLERVVNDHMAEPALDRKKPELVQDGTSVNSREDRKALP